MLCGVCGAALFREVCMHCGTPAAPCVRCGLRSGLDFCPQCGTPQPWAPAAYAPRADPALPQLGSVLWTGGLLAFTVAALVSLAAFLYITPTMILPGIASGAADCEGEVCLTAVYVLTPLWPFTMRVGDPFGGGWFTAYVLVLGAFILGAYAWHSWDLRHLPKVLKRPLADFAARFQARVSWVAVGQVWMASYFLQVVLTLAFGDAAGDPLEGANLPKWYFYYLLAQAGVHEELASRLVFIGIPMGVLSLALAHRLGPAYGGVGRALKRFLGGGLARDAPAPLLAAAALTLVVSSALFALAHAPSWGLWKAVPTFFGGVAMGYVFLRHGLAAAILLHFTHDFFLGAIDYAGEGDAGGALTLLAFIVLAFGGLYALLYLVHGLELVADHAPRLLGRPGPAPAPDVVAPPVPSPPAAIPCPVCGGTAFASGDGRYRCPTCGAWLWPPA